MIVTMVSQKGGVGKSTLALQLAYEWTYRGLNVALVDADPQGTCRVAGDVSAEKGLEAPTVIAMGPGLERPNQVPKLAKSYDHIVIDTPAGVGDIPRAACQVADVAIIPVTPGLSLWSVSRTIDLIRDAQNGRRPDLKGALVSACADPRNSLGMEAHSELKRAGLSLDVFKARTFDRVAWVESSMNGVAVTRWGQDASNASEELVEFIAELERLHKKGRVS